MCCTVLSCPVVSDSATSWTVAARLLCPWGFSRQEYRSALPCPPPGDLSNSGLEPRSPVSLAFTDELFATEPHGKPCIIWG